MSALDDLKALLATATAKCVCTDYRCEHRAAAMELSCVLAFPIAQALVESQEYIEDQDCQNRRDYGGDFCIEWPKSNREDWCDRCVALDDFEKVMKQETPRS